MRELGPNSDPDERPTAIILWPAAPGDQVSDQEGGLDLQASPDHREVRDDFEVNVVRIPVNLPYLEASPPSRFPDDAFAAAPAAKGDRRPIEREDGITLFTAFGRFAAAMARSP